MVPEWGSDPSAIVDRADQALYVAKAEGRDRIRHADDLGLQLPSTLESRERDSARAGAAFVAHGRRSSISPR
jgi:predicted signal transduction protein with EAL and GGDEF domain